MSSKNQRYNKNGDEMCHVFGCRKHKYIKNIFNGKFCKKHKQELSLIRNNILLAKKSKNIEIENFWRQEEIIFRKFHDPGHMYYKLKVEDLCQDIA